MTSSPTITTRKLSTITTRAATTGTLSPDDIVHFALAHAGEDSTRLAESQSLTDKHGPWTTIDSGGCQTASTTCRGENPSQSISRPASQGRTQSLGVLSQEKTQSRCYTTHNTKFRSSAAIGTSTISTSAGLKIARRAADQDRLERDMATPATFMVMCALRRAKGRR